MEAATTRQFAAFCPGGTGSATPDWLGRKEGPDAGVCAEADGSAAPTPGVSVAGWRRRFLKMPRENFTLHCTPASRRQCDLLIRFGLRDVAHTLREPNEHLDEIQPNEHLWLSNNK